MAHASITTKAEDHYYEGGAIRIPFEFTDEHNDNSIDLTGHSVEFRLKEELIDPDTDALVTKTGEESGTGTEVDFTDPTNGRCEIIIESGDDTTEGDTEGVVVDENGDRIQSKVFEWHVRVIDGDGNRVTAETGEWEIWTS